MAQRTDLQKLKFRQGINNGIAFTAKLSIEWLIQNKTVSL